MSKFEWMELETVSNELAHLQSRLDTARVTKNMGLVQLLERDIADAAKRRAQVLADITTGLGVGSSARRKPQLVAVPVHPPLQTPVEQPQLAKQRVEPIPTPVTEGNSSETASSANKTGDDIVWDKLTPADLERVKRGLSTRRSEMLARHAEELKALDAEHGEIDAIEKAIAIFAQKFKLTKSAEVVPLDAERMPAQAG
jgi:hypothetical protein